MLTVFPTIGAFPFPLLCCEKVSRFTVPQVDAAEQDNRCENIVSQLYKPHC